MKIVRNYVIPVFLISFIAAGIIFLLFRSGAFEALELKTLDLRFVIRGERDYPRENAVDAVKIVGIGPRSIEEVGRWPWPRGVIAQLIYGICNDGGMGAFDDSAGWEDAGDAGWEDVPADDGDWEDIPEDAGWEDVPEDDGWEDIPEDAGWEDIPAGDAAETTAGEAPGAGTPADDTTPAGETDATPSEPPRPAEPIGVRDTVGIDIVFDRAERDYSKYLLRDASMMNPEKQDEMAVEALNLCDSVVHISLLKWEDEGTTVGRGDQSTEHYINGASVVYNKPLIEYQTPNSTIGPANMQPSRFDERVRKARMYYKFDNEEGYLFPFAVASLAAWLGVGQEDIVVEEGEYIKVGDYTIPVDKNGDIYINYRGKEYQADDAGILVKENVLSALDIMQTPEMIPLMMEGNHIYMIGVMDPDIKDIFYTPFAQAQSTYPNNAILNGIEIHKEIIDTILQGEYLRDVSLGVVFALILIAAVIVTLLTVYKLWLGAIGMAVIGAAHFYLAVSAFNATGTIYPVFSVIIVLPICFAATIFYRNFVVDREKNQVKKAFGSYVAPHVLSELMDNPDDLKLGGNRSKVSVLFSDIRSFTTISEGLEPDVLIQGLNHYLEEMTNIVLDNSGMIDKFIGDAVMAIWGAPVAHEEDAKKAVRSAVKMEEVLDRIRPRVLELWGNKPGLDINIGVGINTGVATLGNIGSAGKLDYTVIGDTVNLASRLEGLTKQYGAFTIVSESTYNEVKDDFDCCLLDKVMVKGKVLPVGIYQVFCEKGRLPDETRKMLEQYNSGISFYLEKEWEKATVSFKKALAVTDGHKASLMYIERCEHYAANPPPDDWDGSFVWKTK